MQEKSLMDQLYDKMVNEQEKYREWLLQQTPEEILDHTFEYTIRNDILLSISENDLTDQQAKALLSSESPLGEIYRDYTKVETHHMEILSHCIENRANDVIERNWNRNIAQVPVYQASPKVARENDELGLYRDSIRTNVACRDAIENAISDSYRNNRLNQEGALKVLEQYGAERVFYVLANTVQLHPHDGRISSENKVWASNFSIDQTHNREYNLASVHPGLVNIFINQVKEIVQEQAKKPMLNELINSAAKERKEPEKSFDRQEPVK